MVQTESAATNWWRWALRVAGIVCLIIGGIIYSWHPSVSYVLPAGADGPVPVYLTTTCVSPWNELTNHYYPPVPSSDTLGQYQEAIARPLCFGTLNGRKHAAWALGIGAVVLVGLSFLPRRRRVGPPRPAS